MLNIIFIIKNNSFFNSYLTNIKNIQHNCLIYKYTNNTLFLFFIIIMTMIFYQQKHFYFFSLKFIFPSKKFKFVLKNSKK